MARPRASIRAALAAVGVFAALWGRPAVAGEIGPALQGVLADANAGDKIAVIVDLRAAIDQTAAATTTAAARRPEERSDRDKEKNSRRTTTT